MTSPTDAGIVMSHAFNEWASKARAVRIEAEILFHCRAALVPPHARGVAIVPHCGRAAA
jgi:hypothetical protein